MEPVLSADFHMFFILGVTCVAVAAFMRERIPLEISSIALLTIILLFGQIFPILGEDGRNQLSADAILDGFSNPSLMAVMALLVMGQALVQSDALRLVTGVFGYASERFAKLVVYGILILVLLMSAFINNTPLVVIAIPLIQAIAHRAGWSDSRVMIPLSFVAILGGMTTLIGSSTNLLVSDLLHDMGYPALPFFGFFVPGLMMAAAGFVYVVLIVPFFLKERQNMASDLRAGNKEFIAELEIDENSKLVGATCVDGLFPSLEELSVRLIQRGGRLFLPPFKGVSIEAGDVVLGAATRDTITNILSEHPGSFLSEEESLLITQSQDKRLPEERILAEIMITPASRFLDLSMELAAFDKKFGVVVLGMQRRSRIVRRRLGEIRLEAGDVLLVAGRRRTIDALRDNRDFIVLSGSKRDLPQPGKAPLAGGIFLVTILSATFGVLSVPVAAITGAVAMIASRCINIRQAVRAMDRKIFLLVASMMALGTAMQVTGGAHYLSSLMLELPFLNGPFSILACFFLVVALITNLLSNNACAILFTPIAIDLARSLEAAGYEAAHGLPYLFAITVVFAANCSFASPIGYQTNLLVMGPGHYRFSDFMRAGIPLIFVLWGVYLLLLKFYFGV